MYRTGSEITATQVQAGRAPGSDRGGAGRAAKEAAPDRPAAGSEKSALMQLNQSLDRLGIPLDVHESLLVGCFKSLPTAGSPISFAARRRIDRT